MAFTITLNTTLQLDDGEAVSIAKRTVTLEEEDVLGGGVLTSATRVLWDATADGAIDSFLLLVLTSDEEVDVELTTQEGDVNQELATVRVAKDTPLILGSDASRYNHGGDDAYAGALGVIDKIRVRESNGAAARPKLRLYK
jgi:hypothetical protein